MAILTQIPTICFLFFNLLIITNTFGSWGLAPPRYYYVQNSLIGPPFLSPRLQVRNSFPDARKVVLKRKFSESNTGPFFNRPSGERYLRDSLFRNSHFFDSQFASVPQFKSNIWTPGEYEDVSAILVAWGLFDEPIIEVTYWLSNLEASDVFIIVHDKRQQNEAEKTLIDAGVDINYVNFILYNTPQDLQDPQFWVRDFGPRNIFVNGRHAFLDFQFDKIEHRRSNQVPKALGDFLDFPVYEFGLVFSGGNLQVTSDGHGFMTNNILHENPRKYPKQVEDILLQAFGLKSLTIYPGLPPEYDGTNHIDMWLMVLSDQQILVGKYLLGQPGYVESERAVSNLLSRGFIVHRIKQKAAHVQVGGIHESYTNALIVNDVVLVPQYNTPLDQEALLTWETVMPGKIILPIITAAELIPYAGALHCMAQHIYSGSAARRHELKTSGR